MLLCSKKILASAIWQWLFILYSSFISTTKHCILVDRDLKIGE